MVRGIVLAVLLCACRQATGGVDQATVRAAEPLKGELLRYGDWVERALRGHGSDSARAEVLFSPLRLDSRVLGAVVAAGKPARRYGLRVADDRPPGADGWTALRGEGSRRMAGQRASCPAPEGEKQAAKVPCLWLRLDARHEGPVLGFQLWVAYRLDEP